MALGRYLIVGYLDYQGEIPVAVSFMMELGLNNHMWSGFWDLAPSWYYIWTYGSYIQITCKELVGRKTS